jgi:hypothetical protein
MSSKSADWETPDELFARFDGLFHFDLDASATGFNRKVFRYLARDYGFYGENFDAVGFDALSIDWHHYGANIWLNPPYGRGLNDWLVKAKDAAAEGSIIVCLLPARTDTVFYQRIIMQSRAVLFLPGRVTFAGAKDPAPFPSMVAIFANEGLHIFEEKLAELGGLMIPWTRAEGWKRWSSNDYAKRSDSSLE